MDHGNISAELANGIAELRKRINKAAIPKSVLDESLNIATWNIREFGKKKRRNEAIHYIAEIIYQFDLIVLTEVRDNLSDLKRVMDILGPYWKYVIDDFSPDRGGNYERVVYLYDKRIVTFTGLAAEANPVRQKNSKTGEYEALQTWWRSPYMASFKAGDFDFVVLTSHIRWGNKAQERVTALKMLAEWVDDRRNHRMCFDKDFIVMGDFNIPNRECEHYRAISMNGNGMQIPDALLHVKGTNLSQKNTYDQILCYPDIKNTFSNNGGVVDFYQNNYKVLYGLDDLNKQKFTFQLSDHLPLWCQINTDRDDQRLNQIMNR